MKKNIYLDTNVIVRNPEIIGLGTKQQPLIIHSSVYNEIVYVQNRNRIKRGLINLINEAKKAGLIKIKGPDLAPISDPGVRHFQNADNYLYADLVNLQEKKQSCLLVTEDRSLENSVKGLGVEVQTGQEFIESNKLNFNLNTDIVELTAIFQKQQKKSLIKAISLGLLFTSSIILYALNFNNILSILESNFPLLSVLLAPLISIIMFAIRHYYRISYGIVELVIGIMFVIVCIYPENVAKGNFSTVILPYAAAIYVMVRGLDNIDKKIRDYPLIGKIWENLFR
ncbi:PIN domain-containing protein [Leptospira sp. 85282-16]|uniref:PIN domain-containing protein n=1 Tax=Leptospira sp. 85282-16 TaxID=2971256 RepID=UPI0021BFA309|nr:PIN domain-containing protein [Leptospira sp. 85282-16]MCT8335804.1 PIN domain-containing protein [Leptospira sp. 85282-16]